MSLSISLPLSKASVTLMTTPEAEIPLGPTSVSVDMSEALLALATGYMCLLPDLGALGLACKQGIQHVPQSTLRRCPS